MYDRLDQTLVIGVRRTSEKIAKFDLHGRINDSSMIKVAKSSLSKSGALKCCHFCQYQSELMEIHHLDGDHSNWSSSNIRWACPLCHQVNHCFEAGLMGSKLIYAPDIKQQTLNHLQRLIIVLIYHGKRLGVLEQRQKALHLLTLLSQHSAAVLKNWGSDKLTDFALRLHKLPVDQYKKRDIALEGLRVLFNPAIFEKESVIWAKEALDLMPIEKWWKSYEDEVLMMSRVKPTGEPPKGLVQRQVDAKPTDDSEDDDVIFTDE